MEAMNAKPDAGADSGDNSNTSSGSFRRGAVDLSALQNTAGGQASSGGGGAPGVGYAIDVTEANFQSDVITKSMSVPVVLYLWSARAQGIDQFTSQLEKLATDYGGRFLLAKVDVDANQQLAAALQVQAIPTTLGIVRGQPVPLFQGAPAENDVRGVLDQLLQAAVANGVAGRAEPVAGTGPADDTETPGDPRFDAAFDAIDAGEFDKAAEAYQQVLAETPNHPEAKAGLAQVELLKRTSNLDADTERAKADANLDDVDAQLTAADIDVSAGRVEDAFARLIDAVRRLSDDDRDRARGRLLELFEVIGATDPRVIKARGQLASALF